MQTLQLDLGEKSYPIFIGKGLLQLSDVLKPYIKGKQVAVVTNETVAPLYLSQLLSLLSEYQCETVVLSDGEQYKNWLTLQQIFEGLLKAQATRQVTLIALGGGVIGDMTGFAAACYQRGVDFIQVPTTLLAQVDSSVGGKTGINHELGKNMIGAFYQPRAVMIDVETLNTLPDRELTAGLAEVIKYGIIADAEFFAWLEDNIEKLIKRNTDALIYAINRCCAIKAQVVTADEREQDIRATLNLGHSFGHAIEAHEGYGVWLHGEAVSAGMIMALQMSHRLGWLSQIERDRAILLLHKAGLPVVPPAHMQVQDFLMYMKVDKKNLEGQLRLILVKKIGQAIMTSDFSAQLLNDILSINYQQLIDTLLVD